MIHFSEATDWMRAALCAGRDQFVHFADHDFTGVGLNKQERLALHMCFKCPVRSECLNHAIEHKEAHGIWGGTLDTDRKPVLALIARHGPQDARRAIEALDARATARAIAEGLLGTEEEA